MKKLILAALCCTAFACVPVDPCPGQTDCNPDVGYGGTSYCCPSADVCVGLNGSYVCYGYGDVANGQPKADAVSDGPATKGKDAGQQ